MSISSAKLISELQYYFTDFLKASNLNRSLVPFPSVVSSTTYLSASSFVQLLFDDSWPNTQTSYRYLVEEIASKSLWPTQVLNRLCIYSNAAQYYQFVDSTSAESINIFGLSDDDFTMLDKLLQYRLDSTSVILTDVDYSGLSTNLSKMIYLFLDLQMTGSYSNYNDSTTLSDSNSVIESCYEIYLIEKMFNHVEIRGV